MKINPSQITNLFKNEKDKNGIFLLFGTNNGLIEKTYNEIINKLNVDVQDPFSTIKINGLQLLEQKNILIDEISTFSMMAEHKNIILDLKQINNFQNITPILVDCLKSNVQHFKLIIIANYLKTKDKIVKLIEDHQKGFIIPCYNEDNESLKLKIKNYLLTNKINLDEETFSNLILRLSSDTQLNENVFEKINLILFSNKLSSNLLIDLFEDNFEADVDKMCNYLLCGKFSESLQILDKCFSSKISSILICRKLNIKLKQIEKLLHSKDIGFSFEEALAKSGLKFFFKERQFFYDQFKIWKLSTINILMNKIVETEMKCKLLNDLDYSFLENLFVFVNVQILKNLKKI